jgi:hypothetical protein
MAVFLVSFDLRKPERDYGPFFERLRRFTHAQLLESAWFVESAWNAARIRDELFEQMDPDDGLMVALMEGEAGWNRLKDDSDLWLLKRFSQTGSPIRPDLDPEG